MVDRRLQGKEDDDKQKEKDRDIDVDEEEDEDDKETGDAVENDEEEG